ncbi:MAG: Hsp20/alpha crystallin family protein [Labilithrix sp.]|nr:Hsp20/alpha crystallin family protein [Labilithrix sp.]
MTNLTWWRTNASMRSLRRDIDEILEEFEPPAGFRRELDRLLSAGLSPRALRREVRNLFDEFLSPAPLRRRLARRLFADGSRPPLRWRLTRLFDKLTALTGLSRLGRELFSAEPELFSEREDAYVVRLDLRGVRKEDVDVRVEGDMLVISDERSREASFELSRDKAAARFEATHHHGMIEVRIPKREPVRTRKVMIRQPRDSFEAREMNDRGEGRSPSYEPRFDRERPFTA